MINQVIRQEIISFIQDNRISTTEVADALGKRGSVAGLLPLSAGQHVVGKISSVRIRGGSNYAVHQAAELLEKNDIFYIQVEDHKETSIIGDLIAKYSILYKGAAAMVIDGSVRDVSRLLREGYPIWAKSRNPVGASNQPLAPMERCTFDQGVAVCDDGGVVVIAPSDLDLKLLTKLREIEAQEDLWYYCLDTLKWSTLEIVGDKRYLKNPDSVPLPLWIALNESQPSIPDGEVND